MSVLLFFPCWAVGFSASNYVPEYKSPGDYIVWKDMSNLYRAVQEVRQQLELGSEVLASNTEGDTVTRIVLVVAAIVTAIGCGMYSFKQRIIAFRSHLFQQSQEMQVARRPRDSIPVGPLATAPQPPLGYSGY